MTFIDVFISELSDGPDPLEIGGRGPAPMESFFPPDGRRAFGRVIRMIKSGELSGKVNRLGWIGRASKAQILKLIAELYGGNEWHGPGLKDLVAYVDALHDDKEYALVAMEI